MNGKQLARYNVGRQFYQDHLSAVNLYQQLPKPNEYLGFTDVAVAGYLDMLSDDIRTIQERSIVPPSGWHRITDFCPPGMQIASPGGLSFDLNSIASLSASEDASDGHLTINYKNGGTTKITFHRNVDGGPPAIYGLKRKIEEAIQIINSPAVFVKPDMLDHRAADGTLLSRIAAYGPSSITDAATYDIFDKPDYIRGWNDALHHLLEVSKSWYYHRDSEEPPYHVPVISEERRKEIEGWKKSKRE